MDKEKIDKIVWWVPFRSLRDKVRNKLTDISYNNRDKIYKELESISEIMKYSKSEQDIYEHIDFLISQLKSFTSSIPIRTVYEHEDRLFIEDYVESNKELLEKGDILEFFGSELYSRKYSTDKNNFQIACGLFAKGKFDNEVDYYFDFEDENTLPNKQFDCILATQVFMYSVDIVQVLKNFKKLLKPNGTLIITMPFMYTRDYNLDYIPNNTFNISPGGLIRLGEKVFGKENIYNLKYYGNFNYLIYQLLRIRRKENENIEDIICKENDNNSYPMIVGIVYKNK